MSRIIAAVAAIAFSSACAKKDKPDCDAYAERIVRLGSPDLSESRIASVKSVARDACEKGTVTADEARCVIAASSHKESLQCHGLGGDPGSAKLDPTTGHRARSSGFSVAIPAGWTEDTSHKSDGMLFLQADKNRVAFLARVKKGDLNGYDPVASDEACRSATEKSAKSSSSAVGSTKLVDTRLGKACQSRVTEGAMAAIGHAIIVANGDEISVNCGYDSREAEPPPACSEILDSLAIE